ncbi:uncharacterized protein LOC113058903 [Carassius auratus]|uniref:Uncharacterized protein LOC113058903 n=1 Tax=Carassius auratus TaxID=7957 RepID=A0A6P6LE90_CARAU|nr:uncharacterized protein LOC113058903 [Carassius auratus]
MQGYTWSSNQRPSQRYQDRPPPQYQERLQPQIQDRPPPQYQERLQPQYQDRSPPQYHERSRPQCQEQFPPNYRAVRNDQSSAFQVHLIPQHHNTSETRYFNGQQEAGNQWNACSGSANSSTFQQSSNGYDWLKRTNQIHCQQPFAAAHTRQQHPSDNPSAYRCHGQMVQWHDSSPQNHRNTGCKAPMYWSPQSDQGSSVGNSRGWSSHISNKGSSCSMNNQQQSQATRKAAHHHHQQQQQQEFSRQYSGKKRRCNQQYSSQAFQKNPNNQAQSRPETYRTSCNSTTPPSGAQSNVSLPSNNLNQRPVDQNWPELRSNAGPDVSATQPQNNHNAGHQSQGTNNGTCNTYQTSQMTQSRKVQLQPHSETHFNLSSYADSLIYRLLCSDDNELTDERAAHQNTHPENSEVCATKRTDNHSKEPRAQCTVEPPSKRMKYAKIQRDCWNKETTVSKDKSDFRVQSAQTVTHQTSSDENRCKGTRLHNIQYSTDPADCLEVVFALQKAAQQTHKAIAIVSPISQQIQNTAPTADTSPQKAESPQLKIDCVWSLVEESNEQKTVNDKLSESSLQMAQQDNKSLENTTESNIANPDACSANPDECQNDVQQSDCDSSDPLYDLSSVPVIDHTLEKLMDLAKSFEMTELSGGYPEYSESVLERVIKLYWNGKASNMLEPLKSFGKVLHLSMKYAKDYGSVVFKSIETEDLKKLAHCDILKNEMHSSSEEFRSSWLNVDGQPADIEKVLSEPPLDDATVFKATSQTLSDTTVVASLSLGVNSLTDMPEVSSEEESVNPHTSRPTDLFIQKPGNDSEEVTAENNGHSYVMLRKESEKETSKKQEDINQNHNFNTELSDISPLVERSTEKLADLGSANDCLQIQTHDNVSDSRSLSPGDHVSDGVKISEVSFYTETLCTSIDTWQVEDVYNYGNPGKQEALNNSSECISDEENPVSKEVLNNSSEDISDYENPVNKETLNNSLEDISDAENPVNKETLNNSLEDISDAENPVSKEALNNSSEDISDAENPGNKEALNNSSETWQGEDISDEDNSGNKLVLINSSNIWQAGDISDNENPGNMDIPSNSSNICAVEDVSADENSSDDSLFMGITVLSSEDAKTFFQQIEKEPECKTTCCGTENAKSSSTNVTKTDSDADLFGLECWEQAPLFQLEEELYEANLTGSAAKPQKLGQNYSLPCLKLEINKPNLASTKECIMYEGLKEQKSNCLEKSKLEENCSPPSLITEVKESTVASNDECTAYEGLAGQKTAFLGQLEQGHNCSLPSVELKDQKPNVALPETCIAEEGLTGQKSDFIVNSELVECRSRPSLKLEIKESTIASAKECIAQQGQKSDSMMQSEQRQNCNPPSIKLQVNESNFVLPQTCITDEKQIIKSDYMGESELGQNGKPQCLTLEVKEPSVASVEDCSADKGLTGPKSDCMVKSVTKTVSEIQGSVESELTKIQPNKQKNEKTKINGVPKPQYSKKTAFSKHKLKSGSISADSEDSVLFTPDIVVKMNWPQKKTLPGVSAKKHCSGESQNCSEVKKFKEHGLESQDNPDRTSTNHRENLQKVTEKVSGQSNDNPSQESETPPELHGILSVNKITITEPKKVRFDLYGSKTEKQYYAPERRFSAPATLTVTYCKEYNDTLSAKQKVLNQWSSTFIPKTTKTCCPRSPQKGSPQKKKPQKPQDLLKSNMSALKNHLTHRAKLSSSSDREQGHFRKQTFHQKLRKTLSS